MLSSVLLKQCSVLFSEIIDMLYAGGQLSFFGLFNGNSIYKKNEMVYAGMSYMHVKVENRAVWILISSCGSALA